MKIKLVNQNLKTSASVLVVPPTLDGSFLKLFDKIVKTDLLNFRRLWTLTFGRGQQMDLMEIIENKHAKSSTIVASQLPIESWYGIIGRSHYCRCYFKPLGIHRI